MLKNYPDVRRIGSTLYLPTLEPIVAGALAAGTAPNESTVTVSNIKGIPSQMQGKVAG